MVDTSQGRQRRSGHATGAKSPEKTVFHSFATPSALARGRYRSLRRPAAVAPPVLEEPLRLHAASLEERLRCGRPRGGARWRGRLDVSDSCRPKSPRLLSRHGSCPAQEACGWCLWPVPQRDLAAFGSQDKISLSQEKRAEFTKEVAGQPITAVSKLASTKWKAVRREPARQ